LPSWSVHRRWEEVLLGRDYGFIDEWIDSEAKEIDVRLVKRAMVECGCGLSSAWGYGFVDDEDPSIVEYSLQTVIESLKGHDSWRVKPEYMCVTLTYIYYTFGLEGLGATILHILLDEIAKLKYANPNTIREHLKEFIDDVIETLPREDMRNMARGVQKAVLINLEEVLQDIHASRGMEVELSTTIRKLIILYDPSNITRENKAIANRVVELAKAKNIKVELVNVRKLSCSDVKKYHRLVQTISIIARTGLKPRRRPERKLIDAYECTLVIEGGLLVIVEYSDGSSAFYPHYVTMAGSSKYVPVSKLVDQLL